MLSIKIRQLIRLFHINFILSKHGLDEVVLSIPLFAPIRFLTYLNPWNWFRGADKDYGKRMRKALEELGPIFVKFGQMLSTRADLLPEGIILELAKLQDQVPAFPSHIARMIIEGAYGQPIEKLFFSFEPVPLASASVAQVHAAKFHDGTEVVIKVLRPGIEKIIQQDVELLFLFAKLAEYYWEEGKRLHLIDVIKEFEYTILSELDLLREAANASQLRRNFAGSDALYIPKIYWPFARSDVIVMERIYGIPISNVDILKEYKIDLKKLAERGVEIFFTQVFRDCFFHADMHPGNIFVNPKTPLNPQYIAIDFGIMGTLSPRDQRYLAENFVAFFHRDYRRVAELHVESGWIDPNTQINEFEAVIRTVCEPIFERPLKEISFGRTLMRLLQIGRRFKMEVQPQLFLLQKTLLSIEALGRKLYPDLDLWQTAKPFLENWLRKQYSPRVFLKKMYVKMPYWIEKMPELPGVLYEALDSIKQSSKINTQDVESYAIQRKRKGIYLGLASGWLIAAIVIMFLLIQKKIPWHLLGLLSAGFGLAGIIAFLVSCFVPENRKFDNNKI